MKAKRSDIVGISPLVYSESVTHINDKKLLELLSDQFASEFSSDDGLTSAVQDPRVSTMDDITLTTNGIVKLLKDLNSEKACSFDEISASVLKGYVNEVGDVLALLFLASLAQGTIPEEWKHAIKTQVYKGNNKNQSKAENYRSISLTSVTRKPMEHIMYSHIMKH